MNHEIEFVNGIHYVKSVRIEKFSGPYFPAFGPNMEIYQEKVEVVDSLFTQENQMKFRPDHLRDHKEIGDQKINRILSIESNSFSSKTVRFTGI